MKQVASFQTVFSPPPSFPSSRAFSLSPSLYLSFPHLLLVQVEHFWRIYNHLQRPNEFKTTTDYHLFKNGIKPTWEDSQNERGGKWMVRLKKGLTSRYWEELVLAIIGEQFDVGHEICGAVVSIRHNEDIISVWNKNADNTEAKNKIR
jgi:translation initiation factor 4E